MHVTAVITILTGIVLITLCSLNEARIILCTPCPNGLNCDDESLLEHCKWGIRDGFCGRKVCAKGPGERCGGTFDVLGSCGDGLMCRPSFLGNSVEKCRGCSTLTLQCYH